MSNELMLFEDPLFGQTRTITDENGEIWFVVKDVLKALDYPETYRTTRAISCVPKEWASVQPLNIRSENGVEQTRSLLCLSEAGLYFFLGRSDKPKALPYQKKVAGEIIPTIRKTGKYAITMRQPTLLEACRAYVEAADRAEALGQRVIEVTHQRDEIGNNFGAGPEYYKVSEIPWLHELFYHNNQRQLHPALGNKLAQISHDLGYEVKKCQHEKGGHWWRAYHVDAIETLHQELLNNRKLFKHFRKARRQS